MCITTLHIKVLKVMKAMMGIKGMKVMMGMLDMTSYIPGAFVGSAQCFHGNGRFLTVLSLSTFQL